MYTVSTKKLHHRLSTGFQMWIWPEVPWMWGVGGLQVNGICSRRLCTRNWLRFGQTIRTLTSSDLEIPLAVTWLGVTGLKNTRVVYLLDLSEGRGENGQCGLVRVERLQKIGLMVVMLMSYSRAVSMVLVLWGVGPILRNRYGIRNKKCAEVKCQQDDTPEIWY